MRDYFNRIWQQDGLIVAIGSFFYGLQLLLHPHILAEYRIYEIINSFTNNIVIGSLFMTFAITKIISAMLNKRLLRKVGLIGLAFLWGMFFVAFLVSPPPNTVWALALSMSMILVRAATRGDD